MKKIKFLLFFTLFLSLIKVSARDPGDWVGNGASFSENLVLFAYENLDFYIQSCLFDEKCITETNKIDESKPNTLKNIFQSIEYEKKINLNMIQFAPQSNLFVVDGKLKIAVTGIHKGDPIYFNKDMLYELDTGNILKPISLLQIVSILIHEFGHHQGILDHNYLDKIGVIVANQTRFESQFIKRYPRFNKLGAQLVSPRTNMIAPSKLALIDDEKYLDLSLIINKIVQCPQMESQATFVDTVNLWNVYWENPLNPRSRLIAYLAIRCMKSNGVYFDWVGDKLIVEPTIEKTSIGHRFLSSYLNVKIEACSRINGECSANLNSFKKLKELSDRKNKY